MIWEKEGGLNAGGVVEADIEGLAFGEFTSEEPAACVAGLVDLEVEGISIDGGRDAKEASGIGGGEGLHVAGDEGLEFGGGDGSAGDGVAGGVDDVAGVFGRGDVGGSRGEFDREGIDKGQEEAIEVGGVGGGGDSGESIDAGE